MIDRTMAVPSKLSLAQDICIEIFAEGFRDRIFDSEAIAEFDRGEPRRAPEMRVIELLESGDAMWKKAA
jgi:hypothetical protein